MVTSGQVRQSTGHRLSIQGSPPGTSAHGSLVLEASRKTSDTQALMDGAGLTLRRDSKIGFSSGVGLPGTSGSLPAADRHFACAQPSHGTVEGPHPLPEEDR